MEQQKILCLLDAGDLFLKDGQSREAVSCYVKLLGYKPKDEILWRTLNNLGVAHKRLGEYDKSLNILTKAISANPNYLSFYQNAAQTFKLVGKTAEALACIKKSIQISDALNDYLSLIELLKDVKRYKEAMDAANIVLSKFGDRYDALLAVGNLFSHIKAFENAIPYYEKAIELAPDKTQAYNNIGVAYKETMQNDKAYAAYTKALRLNQNDAAAHNNMGNLLRNMDRLEDAVRHLQTSIKLNPSYADAYSNLGAVYKEAKEYETAYGYYKQALALNPEHTNANFDSSLIELCRGEYKIGWSRYEYRLKLNELLAKTHIFKTPLWQSQELKGKTILLQNEQGYGDNIMFIRFAANFVKLGARVLVRTRPQLVELFRGVDGVGGVYSEEEPPPEHDFYLPIMSAAARFDLTPETIPQNFPYIKAPKEPNFGFSSKCLNIGITWSGSKTNKGHKDRYIGLEALSPLFELKKTAWYSLQVGDDVSQIAQLGLSDAVIDKTDMLTDFSKTASMISQLDLVITTDTSVAHLAGALNKETFLLLSKPAEWRWTQEGESTPWYSSIKIFRQSEKGSWREPIEAIKSSLIKRKK